MREQQRASLPDSQIVSGRDSHFVIDSYSSDRADRGFSFSRVRFPRMSARIGLALILLLAVSLRLYGINWDQGGLFHPDERAFLGQVNDLQFPEGEEWSDIFDPAASTLNPGSFNWGSLPHYALKSIQYAVSPFKWMNLFELRFAGRALSAFSDVATVLLVFMIGRAVFSSRVGLLAALLSAVAVQ